MVKGLRGVIVRDAAVQKRLEALNVIAPFVNMPGEDGKPVVPPTGVKFMLREILRGLEMPVDKIIPDPDRQKIIQNIVQQNTPMGATIDPAMAAIQDQTAQMQGQAPPAILANAGITPASLPNQELPPNLPIQLNGRNM